MDIHIGTSGYHYKHWVGTYYPEGMKPKDMLAHYMRDFDTVELNRPFYRLPTRKAFEDWRESAPPGFIYSVKGSRFITHMKKLKEPEANVPFFFAAAEGLAETLGPVLWQLPPFWKCDLARLEVFLATLPRDRRHAFEFRNPTWHAPEVYDALHRHNAAFCPFDIAGFQSPVEVTADWTYIRLHGPSENAYGGAYSRDALHGWADWLLARRDTLRAAYVYFDNDAEANAVRDALALKEIVSEK